MEKEKFFKKLLRWIFTIVILYCIFAPMFYGVRKLDQYFDKGMYVNTVCLQSFPNYCEFEVLDHRENGSSFLRPIIPGYMLHVNQPPYSDRRMPLFNFFMFENFTVRYCHAGLAWLAVPCDEPHVIEVDLRAKNESVYWWEKLIEPDGTGNYPINKDEEEGYTYLY